MFEWVAKRFDEPEKIKAAVFEARLEAVKAKLLER